MAPNRRLRKIATEEACSVPEVAAQLRQAARALRLMLGGVFDRFPKLRIVLGHMGEAVPFWLWRLDFMGRPSNVNFRRTRPNKLLPSEYFCQNFAITTSGVEDHLALRYAIDKIGVDNVMWAIDYPYQPTATTSPTNRTRSCCISPSSGRAAVAGGRRAVAGRLQHRRRLQLRGAGAAATRALQQHTRLAGATRPVAGVAADGAASALKRAAPAAAQPSASERSSRSSVRIAGSTWRTLPLGSRPSRIAAKNSRSCSSMPFIDTSTFDTSIWLFLPSNRSS